MDNILIIEDDLALNQGLCLALKSDDRNIFSCANLKSAHKQLTNADISLVILDINLPDGNGLDFLSKLKAQNSTRPVILLTANDTDMDIVIGLEQGADDYITKPFSLSVLRARVNTQLRKVTSSQTECIFENEKYSFNFDRMLFYAQNSPVELSKTEQKLLRILIENIGNAVSRSTLIDRIWTDGSEYVDENALSVTVKRLRDKLNAADDIQTVYGIGYIWVK